jgi:23S rRNA (guanine745-N1)-methyltransferase
MPDAATVIIQMRLQKNDTSSFVFGFDMSKFGTEHASKQARAHNASNTFYSVSNIFALPLKDESCDVVVSMFAPVASDEFKRILRCGGILVVGAAGVNHLDGLKSVIYEDAYLNEENNLSYNGFKLISREKCDYVAEISGNETIWNLFTMTPYYHRTSLSDKDKLTKIHEEVGTLTARYAKEGEGFLLEEMQKLGFIIVDKTVICCVDQDNKPVPTKQAIAEGYLDAYTKR